MHKFKKIKEGSRVPMETKVKVIFIIIVIIIHLLLLAQTVQIWHSEFPG